MISIGFVSLDIVIILVLAILLIFLTYKTGKKILTLLILGLYPSILIFLNLPYAEIDPGLPEAIAFFIIYIILCSILSKSISNRKVFTPLRKVLDYGSLTFVYIMMLISVSANQIPSLKNIYSFSGYLPNLIEKLNYGLVLIIPIIVLFLTNKSDNN